MATDLAVATEILNQLGGRRFITMTGARSFVGTEASLQFRLPARGKDGADKVRITLTWRDDYTIETFRFDPCSVAASLEPITTEDGVYVDTLREAFTRITGLATSL